MKNRVIKRTKREALYNSSDETHLFLSGFKNMCLKVKSQFEVVACLLQFALFLQVVFGTFVSAVLGGELQHGYFDERWRNGDAAVLH